MKFITLTIFTIFLSACVSTTQHKIIATNTYWIKVKGSAKENEKEVEEKWRNEAENLCGSKGFTVSKQLTDTYVTEGTGMVFGFGIITLETENTNKLYTEGEVKCNKSSNNAIKKDV